MFVCFLVYFKLNPDLSVLPPPLQGWVEREVFFSFNLLIFSAPDCDLGCCFFGCLFGTESGVSVFAYFRLICWYPLLRSWLFVHSELFWNWSLHPQLCWFKTFRFNLYWIWTNHKHPHHWRLLGLIIFHVEMSICVAHLYWEPHDSMTLW